MPKTDFTFPFISCHDDGEYKLLFFDKGDEAAWPEEVKRYVLQNAKCHHCGKPIHKRFHACRCAAWRPDDSREYRLYNWTHAVEDIVLKELRRTAQRNYPSKRRGKVNRKERMASIIGGYNEEDVLRLKSLQNECCYYCGLTSEQLQLDHLTPVARGGAHWFSNLVWACVSCNASKCAKTEPEFWQYLRKRRSAEWYADQKERVKRIRQLRKQIRPSSK